MLIGGLQRFSLLDYPGNLSCIVFTVGCNFSCGYCHNPELIHLSSSENLIDEEKFFEFLTSRVGKLDAVVITGGEPTLHGDLPAFIKKIKKLGFLVKLDSNGTNPDMLSELIKKKIVDYIAMDIKGPLDRYEDITRKSVDVEKIESSIDMIMKSKIPYEFRTTIVKDQLEAKDFRRMAQMISGAHSYYLQKFIPSKTNLKSFMNRKSYDNDTLEDFAKIMSEKVKKVSIR